MHLNYDFTYNSSALEESTDGATWEDPGGGFIKFAVKRASKQDQTLHMEGKLHVILYFRAVCTFSHFAPKTYIHTYPQHNQFFYLN